MGEEDYRGRYRASEGLVFLAYGISDALAVEFEVAVIDAWLDKSATESLDTGVTDVRVRDWRHRGTNPLAMAP